MKIPLFIYYWEENEDVTFSLEVMNAAEPFEGRVIQARSFDEWLQRLDANPTALGVLAIDTFDSLIAWKQIVEETRASRPSASSGPVLVRRNPTTRTVVVTSDQHLALSVLGDDYLSVIAKPVDSEDLASFFRNHYEPEIVAPHFEEVSPPRPTVPPSALMVPQQPRPAIDEDVPVEPVGEPSDFEVWAAQPTSSQEVPPAARAAPAASPLRPDIFLSSPPLRAPEFIEPTPRYVQEQAYQQTREFIRAIASELEAQVSRNVIERVEEKVCGTIVEQIASLRRAYQVTAQAPFPREVTDDNHPQQPRRDAREMSNHGHQTVSVTEAQEILGEIPQGIYNNPKRLDMLLSVISEIREYFADNSKVRKWLTSPKRALGGRVPLDLITNDEGQQLLDGFWRLAHGVF